jgi:hypothetical protein
MPADAWISDLEHDGFVVVKDFFDRALVERARAEVAPLANPAHKGPYEYLTNIYGESPTLDAMVEKMLTDQDSSELIRAMAGPNIKLRGYNVRRMTGEFDPAENLNPAMDWHQDAPGEFCLALVLEEALDAENAATAAVLGSHWFPFNPRWNCMFGTPFIFLNERGEITKGLSIFSKLNFFSRALARRVLNRSTAISSKPGDFYIFLNDIWHGRCPNLHGKKGMVVMIGGFPSDLPYPDSVAPPDKEVLDKLPPRLRAAAGQTNPAVGSPESILYRLAEHRRTAKPTGLFLFARLERRLAEAVSRSYRRGYVKPFSAWNLWGLANGYWRYELEKFARHEFGKLIPFVWGKFPEFVKTLVRRLARRQRT